MPSFLRVLTLASLLLALPGRADHVIVTGGPALRKWENLRVLPDQHDRWWANFVRASTLRMAEIRQAYGPDAPLVWLVYQPGYQTRGREDGKPYTTWISQLAAERHATLVWFSSTNGFHPGAQFPPARLDPDLRLLRPLEPLCLHVRLWQ